MSKPTLPMLDGVCASTLYLEKLHPTPLTIFEFLCQKFPHISSKNWQYRFETHQVFDHQGHPLSATCPYAHGQNIYYYRYVDNEPNIPFEPTILFENDELMVVDKPHFLATTPTGSYVKHTLLSRLKHSTQNPNLSVIHRLDKETAGLVLVSKNPKTRHAYQSLFANHAIKKTYHAIAPYCPTFNLPKTVALHLQRGEPFYTMHVNPSLPPNSTTHISIIDQKDIWAKYQLHPITGKLHQLRVHLNHIGIPIKNDRFYPNVIHADPNDFHNPLQLLAYRLSFIDPINGQVCDFYSQYHLEW